MKKRSRRGSLLVLLSAMMIVLLSLSGCGKDESAQTDKQDATLSDTVHIVTQAGSGEEATASMTDGFKVAVFQKESEVEDKVLNNNYDLAVVSANTAAKLYQLTGGKLVVISPVALNDWFIGSNKGYITSQQISDLQGKTIFATWKGGTGEYILRKLLQDNGINPDYGVYMKWFDTSAQVIKALKTSNTVGLLQEPYASLALGVSSTSNGLKADIDLGALWESQYESSIPSDVLIANKQFVKERAGDLQLFISEYEKSMETAKKSSAANLVFYGRSNRGIDLIKNFMALMEEYDINSLGGKNLDAAFYYGIGE